jgi:hypothetical protein
VNSESTRHAAAAEAAPALEIRILAAVFGAAVLAIHFLFIPRTIWEYDESFFLMALEKYEPLLHHPPPPGYPLYIGFSKLLYHLTALTPFHALLAVSFLATAGGFIAYAAAFHRLTGSIRLGILGAALLYLSPAMLLHATLPQSDSGAMTLLGIALWLGVRAVDEQTSGTAVTFALAAAVTIGWRLQFSIAVGPLFLATVFLLKNWRERVAALQAFTVACLAWLIPLIAECGSLALFWKMLSGQAEYFAVHDANLSRNGIPFVQLVFRFLAHPWGPKWLSFPILALAVAGMVVASRRRERRVVPIAVLAFVYFAFAFAMMDPADGVRYVLPALPCIVAFVLLGIDWLRSVSRDYLFDWAVVVLYGVGAFAYTAPVLEERASHASPPVAAIESIRRSAPANAVVLYDLALRPHAEYLLRGFTVARIDEGLLRFGHRTDLPLYELVDGDASREGGAVFRWPASDAYAKLTRQHYRVTSVIAVPVPQRYLAVSGIWPPERARTESWRWVSDQALILLPDIGARQVKLTFVLPHEHRFESNRLTVQSDSATVAADVKRGAPVEVVVPIPAGRARLRITAARSVVPSELGGVSRDDRKLAVMLTRVEQIK